MTVLALLLQKDGSVVSSEPLVLAVLSPVCQASDKNFFYYYYYYDYHYHTTTAAIAATSTTTATTTTTTTTTTTLLELVPVL